MSLCRSHGVCCCCCAGSAAQQAAPVLRRAAKAHMLYRSVSLSRPCMQFHSRLQTAAILQSLIVHQGYVQPWLNLCHCKLRDKQLVSAGSGSIHHTAGSRATHLLTVTLLLCCCGLLEWPAGAWPVRWCCEPVGVWPCMPLQHHLPCQDYPAGPVCAGQACLEPTQGAVSALLLRTGFLQIQRLLNQPVMTTML